MLSPLASAWQSLFVVLIVISLVAQNVSGLRLPHDFKPSISKNQSKAGSKGQPLIPQTWRTPDVVSRMRQTHAEGRTLIATKVRTAAERPYDRVAVPSSSGLNVKTETAIAVSTIFAQPSPNQLVPRDRLEGSLCDGDDGTGASTIYMSPCSTGISDATIYCPPSYTSTKTLYVDAATACAASSSTMTTRVIPSYYTNAEETSGQTTVVTYFPTTSASSCDSARTTSTSFLDCTQSGYTSSGIVVVGEPKSCSEFNPYSTPTMFTDLLPTYQLTLSFVKRQLPAAATISGGVEGRRHKNARYSSTMLATGISSSSTPNDAIIPGIYGEIIDPVSIAHGGPWSMGSVTKESYSNVNETGGRVFKTSVGTHTTVYEQTNGPHPPAVNSKSNLNSSIAVKAARPEEKIAKIVAQLSGMMNMTRTAAALPLVENVPLTSYTTQGPVTTIKSITVGLETVTLISQISASPLTTTVRASAEPKVVTLTSTIEAATFTTIKHETALPITLTITTELPASRFTTTVRIPAKPIVETLTTSIPGFHNTTIRRVTAEPVIETVVTEVPATPITTIVSLFADPIVRTVTTRISAWPNTTTIRLTADPIIETVTTSILPSAVTTTLSISADPILETLTTRVVANPATTIATVTADAGVTTLTSLVTVSASTLTTTVRVSAEPEVATVTREVEAVPLTSTIVNRITLDAVNTTVTSQIVPTPSTFTTIVMLSADPSFITVTSTETPSTLTTFVRFTADPAVLTMTEASASPSTYTTTVTAPVEPALFTITRKIDAPALTSTEVVNVMVQPAISVVTMTSQVVAPVSTSTLVVSYYADPVVQTSTTIISANSNKERKNHIDEADAMEAATSTTTSTTSVSSSTELKPAYPSESTISPTIFTEPIITTIISAIEVPDSEITYINGRPTWNQGTYLTTIVSTRSLSPEELSAIPHPKSVKETFSTSISNPKSVKETVSTSAGANTPRMTEEEFEEEFRKNKKKKEEEVKKKVEEKEEGGEGKDKEEEEKNKKADEKKKKKEEKKKKKEEKKKKKEEKKKQKEEKKRKKKEEKKKKKENEKWEEEEEKKMKEEQKRKKEEDKKKEEQLQKEEGRTMEGISHRRQRRAAQSYTTTRVVFVTSTIERQAPEVTVTVDQDNNQIHKTTKVVFVTSTIERQAQKVTVTVDQDGYPISPPTPRERFMLRTRVIHGHARFQNLTIQLPDDPFHASPPKLAPHSPDSRSSAIFYRDESTTSIALCCSKSQVTDGLVLVRDRDNDAYGTVLFNKEMGTARINIDFPNGGVSDRRRERIVWNNDRFGSWLVCQRPISGVYELKWWDVVTNRDVDHKMCAKVSLEAIPVSTEEVNMC